MSNLRQSLPETRSSALPYPTAPEGRLYKRHARQVENFDHCEIVSWGGAGRVDRRSTCRTFTLDMSMLPSPVLDRPAARKIPDRVRVRLVLVHRTAGPLVARCRSGREASEAIDDRRTWGWPPSGRGSHTCTHSEWLDRCPAARGGRRASRASAPHAARHHARLRRRLVGEYTSDGDAPM